VAALACRPLTAALLLLVMNCRGQVAARRSR
jgi:hypothetical protein